MSQLSVDAQKTLSHWKASLESQWETSLGVSEWAAKVAWVQAFSEAWQQAPDEIIAACMETSDEMVRATVPAMRKNWNRIVKFRADHGLVAANTVMSFFIHNGILMQAPGEFGTTPSPAPPAS